MNWRKTWVCHVEQRHWWFCSWYLKRYVHDVSCEPFSMTTRQIEWHVPCHSSTIWHSWPRLSGTHCHGWQDMGSPQYPRNETCKHGLEASVLPVNQEIQGRTACWAHRWLPWFWDQKVVSISWTEEQQLTQMCMVQHWKVYEVPPDGLVLDCWQKGVLLLLDNPRSHKAASIQKLL